MPILALHYITLDCVLVAYISGHSVSWLNEENDPVGEVYVSMVSL
jgi:hypothetical protein